jgi:hypothetical protein
VAALEVQEQGFSLPVAVSVGLLSVNTIRNNSESVNTMQACQGPRHPLLMRKAALVCLPGMACTGVVWWLVGAGGWKNAPYMPLATTVAKLAYLRYKCGSCLSANPCWPALQQWHNRCSSVKVVSVHQFWQSISLEAVQAPTRLDSVQNGT